MEGPGRAPRPGTATSEWSRTRACTGLAASAQSPAPGLRGAEPLSPLWAFTLHLSALKKHHPQWLRDPGSLLRDARQKQDLETQRSTPQTAALCFLSNPGGEQITSPPPRGWEEFGVCVSPPPVPTLAGRGDSASSSQLVPFHRVESSVLRSAGCVTWTGPGISASPSTPSPGWMAFQRRAACPQATTSGNPGFPGTGFLDVGRRSTGCSKESHLQQPQSLPGRKGLMHPPGRFRLKIGKDFLISSQTS